MSEPTNEGPGPSAGGMSAMLGPGFLADPYALYASFYRSSPVLWSPNVFGLGAWVITSHAACSAVLRNKNFGKEGNKVLPAEVLARIPQEISQINEHRRSNMLFRDPPDHTRLRGLVNQAFTPRTIVQLRPHIIELAERLVDAMQEKGSADLIHDFAFPLPIIVIAELLGVPPEDRQQFKAWSTVLMQGLNPSATPEHIGNVLATLKPMNEYLLKICEARRAAPQNDLISGLVQVQSAGDRLSREELLATCRLLLTAGHETTVNLIGNGMLALLRNPQQRAELQAAAEPAVLSGAIEELLRYDSPVQMTTRFAYEDTSLGDKTVKRGDLVLVLIGGANRDPAQFSDPDRLYIQRENAHSNLAFGAGIHYCLGAPLARLEGEIAVGTLLRRLPKLALDTQELSYRPNIVLRGLKTLPVTF